MGAPSRGAGGRQGGLRGCGGGGAGAGGAGRAFALREVFPGCGAIERVDGFLGRGRGGIAGFRVAVAKRGGIARGLRGPEIAGRVFVEGFERGGLIHVLAGGEHGGAEIDFVFGGHPVFVAGVDGLPDGEEAIDVDVMEPEDRIESCVVDLR